MTRKFVFHGGYLIVIGVIAVLFNPHTGHFGFNPDAKSGLIVTGLFALISYFWALMYSRQAYKLAIYGSIVTTLLLFVGTVPRAVNAWIDYVHGDTAKWFAATTISLVVIGSLPLFTALLRHLRSNLQKS
jgi:energy-coupling factor transporter transmembrane protein EcfT